MFSLLFCLIESRDPYPYPWSLALPGPRPQQPDKGDQDKFLASRGQKHILIPFVWLLGPGPREGQRQRIRIRIPALIDFPQAPDPMPLPAKVRAMTDKFTPKGVWYRPQRQVQPWGGTGRATAVHSPINASLSGVPHITCLPLARCRAFSMSTTCEPRRSLTRGYPRTGHIRDPDALCLGPRCAQDPGIPVTGYTRDCTRMRQP